MNNRNSKPKVLMLVPSYAKTSVQTAVQADAHPTMDYFALQKELGADIADYGLLEREAPPAIVKLARKAGRDAALAAYGFTKRNDYDVIFSNGENVSIPLCGLLKGRRKRPLHVLIGHRVSPPKKKPFFRAFHPQMDAIFLYATPQLEYAKCQLGIPAHKLHLIPFHADARFYRPLTTTGNAPDNQICSAGLEWRDYPTLIEAVTGMDVSVKLAAASPWSKHRNETESRTLPANVSARKYEYNELRELYSESRFVVAPLYENDFQAGITTILEGMAMGKAIITTRTTGQADTIREGENGLYVAPGDVNGWRNAIQKLLEHPEQAERMGAQGRRDIEERMSLDRWVENISKTIYKLHCEQGSA